MKTKKRLLSFLTCVAMLVAMVPMNVFAADEPKGTHYEENIVLEGQTPNATGQYEITLPDLKYYEDTVTVNIKHTPKGHNCDEYFKYLGADEFKYMYIPAEPPFYPNAEEHSSTGLLFIAREITNPIYVAFKIKDSYYSLYDDNTTAITKPFIVNANTNYNVDIQHNFLQSIFGTNYEMSDTTSLDTLLDEVELVVFKDATFNNKIASYKWSDLIETTYDCPGHNRGYTFNMYYDAQNNLCISNLAAEASIVYTVNGTEYAVGAQVDVNGETITIKKYDEATQTYTYTFDNSVFSERDKVTLSYCASDDVVESNIVLAIDLEATHKTVDTSPEVTTVTVTPTISVTDMPADGTMKEGFDITFKSNAPVVLSTQEAPDVSVCNITNKQADGFYTGVYHVDAIGNKDIKFNVNPTVASELSEDGLTKTVYNSTVYTLNITAFDPGVSTPDIDDEGTVPDDDVTVEIPEETDPSDPNGPDKIPQTGDTTPIIPLMITMLVSLTVVIFCIVHRKKAKTLLSVVLVVVMLGVTLTGIQMNPTPAYAAGEGLDSTPPVSSGGDAVVTGSPSTSSSYSTAWIFTLVDTSRIDTFLSNGWQTSTLQAADMSCVYLVGSDHANKYAKNNQIWVQYETSGNSGRNLSLHSKSDLINLLYANVSLTKPAASSDMATILNPLYAIDDNETKAKITNSLFNASYTAAEMATKNIVAVPIFVYANKGGTNYYGLTQMYHYKTGLTVYAHPCMDASVNGWNKNKKLTQSAWNHGYAINAHNSLFFKDTVHPNMTKTINVGVHSSDANAPYTIKEWGGIGSIFKAGADKTPVIKTEDTPATKTAYSSYINFALDSKNTTVKYTNDYTNYKGYSGWNFANSDSYITFNHNYIIRRTYTDNVLTKTEYIDDDYTKSGSLNINSGTKVTGNSVFNEQGYAVSSVPSGAEVYAYPYISYKWVSVASGGIGSVWSLDIGTHPGVAYDTTNYFLSVADYKSYAGTIPTLDTIKSYLSKNANESGVNRFSNSGYVKFRADFSSPTMYNFLSIDNSVKTSLASQNENRDSVIFTATYTPVSITSNIKLVEVVQDGSTLKVKSVTNGASTSYVNTSTGSLTTPSGYTYYKAVAEGGTGVNVGDVVTSSGLISCNKTALKVGSSAIDKGYTIYCYKLPDTWAIDSNISTYVGEDYVNNVDFTYTSYVSGSWKYNGAPTVTGNLTSINSYWIAKANAILGGNAPETNSDNVSKLAHQRTFMLNVNRNAYQTLNLSPFVSNSAANANKNGLAGVSAQISANKVNTTMDSGAAAYYNNYYTVSGRKVFQPLSSLTNQVNTWKGSTDSFTVNGFTFSKAEVTYKNTTYVGVYNAPSIGTQAVTNNTLTNNGKVYTEVSNTGTKLEFVPHYNMKVVTFSDGSEPYHINSRHYYNVSVMSNYKRSFNSAMLSGYTFTTGAVSGTTSSDYVDNNGDTLKGSDVTLKVSNPTLSLNTFAYVVDIYGDGDSTELINGYNPASQWGINKYSELLGKVNTKFSNYLTTVQNNLEYSVVLDNEGTKYKDFTVSTSKANPNTSVTADTQTFVLTIKNGAIANDTAYQSMIASIKADFGLASTAEAEALFNNSGIKNMIVNSMHTSAASNNTSANKWYDEQVNTICIRRFAKTGIQLITNAVVQDKIDYNSEKGDGEWTFIVKNGSATILETEIDGADFEISDKTTQSN